MLGRVIEIIRRKMLQPLAYQLTGEPEFNLLLEMLLSNIELKEGIEPEIVRQEHFYEGDQWQTNMVVKYGNTLYTLMGFQDLESDRTKFSDSNIERVKVLDMRNYSSPKEAYEAASRIMLLDL